AQHIDHGSIGREFTLILIILLGVFGREGADRWRCECEHGREHDVVLAKLAAGILCPLGETINGLLVLLGRTVACLAYEVFVKRFLLLFRMFSQRQSGVTS